MAFEKIKKFISRKKEIPGDLWMKCPDCKGMIFKKEVEDRKKVCTECQYHFTITPSDRNSSEGFETPRSPLPVISNTPSSLTAPKRFFTARLTRCE